MFVVYDRSIKSK